MPLQKPCKEETKLDGKVLFEKKKKNFTSFHINLQNSKQT